jgi:hypothetical protein
MPRYRIFRMKDTPRQHFRWAPHTSGVTSVKLRDFEESGTIEARNVYAAWQSLKESEQPLDIGDLLETELGEIRIYKYVGFEEAKWIVPEVKSGFEGVPLALGVPQMIHDPVKI